MLESRLAQAERQKDLAVIEGKRIILIQGGAHVGLTKSFLCFSI